MQAKKKNCDGCDTDQYIWKREGRKLYCSNCWKKKELSSSKSVEEKPTKTVRIRPRSSKRQKQEVLYLILRKSFLEAHPICMMKIPTICQHSATDVHHPAGRSGEMLLDDSEFIAGCRACHTWVHEHDKEARELGFLKSRA